METPVPVVVQQNAPSPPTDQWGLSGPWGFIAKAGILGGMFVLVFFMVKVMLSQSSEREAADRQMYREDMREQRTMANDALSKLSVEHQTSTQKIVSALDTVSAKIEASTQETRGLRGDIRKHTMEVPGVFGKVEPKIAPLPHEKNDPNE